MFELLKILVEALSKSFSLKAISDLKRSQELTDLGMDLFVLYCGINNLIVVGDAIVAELEKSLDWMERKVAEGVPEAKYYSKLESLLNRQAVAIANLRHSIRRLEEPMVLIAPDVYRSLEPLLIGKSNAIRTLISILSGPNPRLVSASQELERIHAGDRERGAQLFESVAIENVSVIPANKKDVIRSYVDDRNPKAVVSELETLATVLREAILKNFEVQDILLKVGDRRATVTMLK